MSTKYRISSFIILTFLYEVDVRTINDHSQKIYDDGELTKVVMKEMSNNPCDTECGYQVLVELGRQSEINGLSDMSLDEINAEINALRNAGKADTKRKNNNV